VRDEARATNWQGMDKTSRKALKTSRKAEWKAFKQKRKAMEKEYRSQRREQMRERKEARKERRRAGKMKMKERRDMRKSDCTRGGGVAGTSVESLQDDVYAQAKEMLWVVVLKHVLKHDG